MSLQDKMRRKTNLWNVAKVFCLFACLGYLAIQSLQLLLQYLSDETQVSVNYSYHDNAIPGITICYPKALSLFSIVKNLKDQGDEFLPSRVYGVDHAFFDTLTEDDFDKFNKHYINRAEKGDKVIKDFIDSMKKQLNQSLAHVSKLFGKQVQFPFADILYWKMLHKLANKKYHSPSAIFNSSIPFTKINYGEWRELNMVLRKPVIVPGAGPKTEGPPLDVSVYGMLKGIDATTTESKMKDDDPIESIIFMDELDWKKCFTFFSHLKPKWRDIAMVVNRINIDVFIKELWFSELNFRYDGYSLALHDPKGFSTQFRGVRAYRDVKIDYSVEATNQTQVKDIVKCREYDITSRLWWERTRSDCMKKCLQDKEDKCANCSRPGEKCFFEGLSQWTAEQMPWEKMVIVNLNMKTNLSREYAGKCSASRFHFATQCRRECPQKCVDRDYSLQIQSIVESFASRVEIKHQLPDTLNEVTVKMSWVDYFSQQGGLFGLWMGLSVYAISDILIKSFRYLTKSFKAESDEEEANQAQANELREIKELDNSGVV